MSKRGKNSAKKESKIPPLLDIGWWIWRFLAVYSFSLTLTENRFKGNGCASCLRLFCDNCGWRSEFHSSKKQTQSFEVNRRLVYTMRLLGKGHGGAKKFCTLMNMPPPSAAKPFKKSSNTITKAIKIIAKKSMSDAAAEIRSAKNAEKDDIVNCPVSCDGTWQRVPKEVFVGKDVLEFGLFGAVSHFNMGAETVLQLYEALEIPAGKCTEDGCQFLDAERSYMAVYKDQEHNKMRRKVLRGKKKRKEDKSQHSEGVTYAAVQF